MMKFAKNLLFVILSFSTFIAAQQYTPENTALIFDVDKTIIKKSPNLWLKVMVVGLSWNIKTAKYLAALASMLTKKEHEKDKDDKKIEGATYQLLLAGMNHPALRPHVPKMLETANKSRQFITGMEKLIRYLNEEKKYEINYATNNDNLTYKEKSKHLEKLGQFPKKVIVAQPPRYKRLLERLDQEKENLPDSYRKLLEKAKNIKPTGKIYHAPATKPAAEYFKTVNSVIKKPKKIFIDDKEENVGAAKAAGMEGIRFINTGQLVNELINLGVLSEEKDKVFLEELRNASIMGKVNEKAKKFWNYLLISFFQHNKKTA